jgi:hypothetical protein
MARMDSLVSWSSFGHNCVRIDQVKHKYVEGNESKDEPGHHNEDRIWRVMYIIVWSLIVVTRIREQRKRKKTCRPVRASRQKSTVATLRQVEEQGPTLLVDFSGFPRSVEVDCQSSVVFWCLCLPEESSWVLQGSVRLELVAQDWE